MAKVRVVNKRRGSKCEGNGRINQQQKNKRKEKKNTIIQVSVPTPIFRFLSATHATRRNFISMPTGLYMECPHHRNTQTYTGPESSQAKNVDLATEKS